MGKCVFEYSKLGSLMVAYILSTTPLNEAATARKNKKGPKLKSAWTLLLF
jgi:hypothetical protein